MKDDEFNEKVLNNEFSKKFVLGKEKSMTLAYLFAILYIWYELNRILEKCSYNGICIFYLITIGVYGGWYNTSTGLAIVWIDGRATNETVSETASEPAGKAASRTADGVISGATIKAIDGAINRAASGVDSGVASRFASRANDRAISKVAGGITNEAIGRATGKAGTIGVRIDIMIILTNLLVYVFKFEK